MPEEHTISETGSDDEPTVETGDPATERQKEADARAARPPVRSRRAVLSGTAAGAIGVGAGLLLGRLGVGPDRALSGSVLERADSADSGMKIARYGTRRVVWSVEVAEPVAAITFDDGPDPQFTPRILAALDAAGVKATFNVMGYNGVHHASLLKEVVAAGHELGNHTWSHQDLSFETEQKTRDEIVRCKDEIGALLGIPFASFRPPRGKLNGSGFRVCAELGYDVYIWSVARGPSKVHTSAEVADFIGTNMQPGDVLGLHDSIGRGVFAPDSSQARQLRERREVEVKALPEVLARVADKGISLVPATVLSAKAI